MYSGGDEYLESDFCWKFSYHIQRLCPRGQGGGGLKIIENVRASFMDDPYGKQTFFIIIPNVFIDEIAGTTTIRKIG